MQEDPIWFSAGDLNVHRYVWNNPLNWVDPSGLSAEYIIAGGIAGSLAQGNIATETDFSSGANTAAFLRGSDLNPLSATAGNINCAFYILGAAIAEGGNGETSVDAEKCGVDVKPVEDGIKVAVKDDIKLFSDALKLACREKGVAYTRALRRRFHDRITGQGIDSFSDMLEEARCFLDEGGN